MTKESGFEARGVRYFLLVFAVFCLPSGVFSKRRGHVLGIFESESGEVFFRDVHNFSLVIYCLLSGYIMEERGVPFLRRRITNTKAFLRRIERLVLGAKQPKPF
jgi:hypothetical protein